MFINDYNTTLLNLNLIKKEEINIIKIKILKDKLKKCIEIRKKNKYLLLKKIQELKNELKQKKKKIEKKQKKKKLPKEKKYIWKLENSNDINKILKNYLKKEIKKTKYKNKFFFKDIDNFKNRYININSDYNQIQFDYIHFFKINFEGVIYKYKIRVFKNNYRIEELGFPNKKIINKNKVKKELIKIVNKNLYIHKPVRLVSNFFYNIKINKKNILYKTNSNSFIDTIKYVYTKEKKFRKKYRYKLLQNKINKKFLDGVLKYNILDNNKIKVYNYYRKLYYINKIDSYKLITKLFKALKDKKNFNKIKIKTKSERYLKYNLYFKYLYDNNKNEQELFKLISKIKIKNKDKLIKIIKEERYRKLKINKNGILTISKK